MPMNFKDGLCFFCKQCSCCCGKEPGFVYLSQSDLTKLSQWFKLNEQEFINKYCRLIPYFDGTFVLCLKEKENYDCILWDKGCSAYSARPVQCSTYPFWSRILSSKEMWEEESHSCPGINSGKHWTYEEILTQLNEYKNNEPLHIKKEED